MQTLGDLPGCADDIKSTVHKNADDKAVDTQYAVLCDKAQSLFASGELGASIKAGHAAVSIGPGQLRAYHIIASCHMALGDWVDALEAYEWAWLIDPSDTVTVGGVHSARGHLQAPPSQSVSFRPWPELRTKGFYSQACKQFVDIRNLPAAFLAGGLAMGEKTPLMVESMLAGLGMEVCNWSSLQPVLKNLESDKWREHLGLLAPWLALNLVDNPKRHLELVQNFFQEGKGHQSVRTRKLRVTRVAGRRPRVGYLSADFHDHATTRLMVGMLEQHDRSRWEMMGLSYGANDNSPMRRRVEPAFERFVDLHGLGEAMAIEQVHALGLDLLVDAKGLTTGFISGFTLSRPAPVVVNYLAYPGSMGSSAYDYVLGDSVVTPFNHQQHYTECIAQLPHSYQCNDPLRDVAVATPTKAESGLPDDAIVLAAFNNTRKITAEVFAVWMRILHRIPQGVIWLVSAEKLAQSNLRAAAQLHGISPDRLVFAPILRAELHMARHRLADLFLDTHPYNAHTTASDALWMGVPVITLQGESFAARVASSLLYATGLPELVTQNWDDYEELVVNLASDSTRRGAIKAHLLAQRAISPLFDAGRLARNMEQAFAFMIDRSRIGKPPHPFSVRDAAQGGGVRLAGSKAYKTDVKLWQR